MKQKTPFEKWWNKIDLPWWMFGNPTLNPMQHFDLRKLSMKAYKLGRKHEREICNNHPRD